ncbi:GGDEF domain-containing protein [Roseibium sp. RKSG952]|uniref:GGDEF domain-containing protein n=1 Tax=Roseibium sp. RKSG952 TaxID=2529384 RepID=UPI0012BC25A3|nr:GGDEF domain-containing protein [Roseibium sp. RKSG952]MTH98983.1 GGDEF domain-containing protein [Roseibium sp. RKSG952]
MRLDSATLYTSITFASFAGAGVLMLFLVSLRHRTREISASAIVWSLGLLCIAVGTLLIGLRGEIPNFISIFLANAFTIMGAGLRPNAIAIFFEGKRFLWAPLLLALSWMLLLQLPGFRDSVALRVAFVQGTLLIAALAMAWMCIRLNREKLASARILTVIVLFEATSYITIITVHTLNQPRVFLTTFQSPAATYNLSVALISIIATTMCVAAMALERIQNRLHEKAMEDDLTGLPNRRAFFFKARQLLESSGKHHSPYAVILLDIDHFKSVNDRFGHAEGDRVLRLMGQITRDTLPKDAIPGRLGGEEFAIVLAETSADLADMTAKRLAKAFSSASKQVLGNDDGVTFSAGISLCPPQTLLEHAMVQADHCLYEAKRRGRNLIVVADPEAAGLLDEKYLRPAMQRVDPNR